MTSWPIPSPRRSTAVRMSRRRSCCSSSEGWTGNSEPRLFSRVADSYGIHLIRIRIQHFRLNTDPDPRF
jgi:hypothetical protein